MRKVEWVLVEISSGVISATTSGVQEVRSAQLLQVECTCPLVAPQASWIVH